MGVAKAADCYVSTGGWQNETTGSFRKKGTLVSKSHACENWKLDNRSLGRRQKELTWRSNGSQECAWGLGVWACGTTGSDSGQMVLANQLSSWSSRRVLSI